MDPLPAPTPESAGALIVSVRDLVNGSLSEDAKSLHEVLRQTFPHFDARSRDDFPPVLDPVWSSDARRDIAWRLLGMLVLRDYYNEVVCLSRDALVLFGLDAAPGYHAQVAVQVLEEVALLPARLQDAVLACLPPGEYYEETEWGPVSGPADMNGLLSYAVARATLPYLAGLGQPSRPFAADGRPGPGELFVSRVVGEQRWEALVDVMKERGLIERLDWGLDVPEGPCARALVIAGPFGDVPGVPDSLNWGDFADDLERTIVDEPEMYLNLPF